MAMGLGNYGDALNATNQFQMGAHQNACPTLTQVRDPSRASIVLDRFQRASQHLSELCRQADAIVDRVLGPEPDMNAKCGQGIERPPGVLGEMGGVADELSQRLADLQSVLQRLDAAF